MITDEIIKETALLCKLYIDDSELCEFTKDMQRIVEFADRVNSAHTQDDIQEDNTVYDYALREDETEPSLDVNEILLNAPESENGFFSVHTEI